MPRHSLANINHTICTVRRKKDYRQYFNEDPLKVINSNTKHNSKEKKHLRKPKSKSKSKSKPQTSRKIDMKKKSEDHSQRKHQVTFQQKLTPNQNRFSIEYDSPQRQHEDYEQLFINQLTNQTNNQKVQIIIDRVYQKLRENRLKEAINLLQETLSQQPEYSQLKYLLGACYLVSSEIEAAQSIFESILTDHPRKNIYLLLSVCYKKMEQREKAKALLNICIEKYPRYHQAYVYRAKLYLKENELKRAILDFQKAITLKPQKIIGYIGRGDCLRLASQFSQARAVYIQGLSIQQQNHQLLVRKAICELQLGKLELALISINTLLKTDPENSQALYFQGLIYRKKDNQNEAIMCFEQALKFNTNKRAVTRSIYELAKIKIQCKDYYEAVYTLERAQHLDTEQKVLNKLKIFTSGIISLMKKNFPEGLTSLGRLDQESLNKFLKPLFYSARAYGYMNERRYGEAKLDFDSMDRQFSLDNVNLYNKFICEGILACNDKKYEQALSFFSKAGKVLPKRIQPSFYKAVCLVSFTVKLIPKTMPEKRTQYINSALRTVSKVQKITDSNPSLFLVRGALYYALGHVEEAHEDFKSCITDSIKPNWIAFYLNGLTYGELERYSDAIKQFQNAIHYCQNSDSAEVYLSRAKCMLLMGDINNAFLDLQAYMSARPNSPDIHIWAGHLLFHIGAWEDAAKAYSNISNLSSNFQVMLYKSKCHFISRDVATTISNLRVMKGIKADPKIQFDLQLLEMLQICAEDPKVDYRLLLGRLQSLRTQLLNNKDTREEVRNTLEITYFFTQADYQFFRGVFKVHSGDSHSAISCFKKALEQQQKLFESRSSKISPLSKMFSRLTYGNLTFNRFQILYNTAVTYILAKELKKAIKCLKQIIQRLKMDKDTKVAHEIQIMIAILSKEELNDTQKTKKQQIQIIPFLVESRLCSILPEVKITMKQHIIITRLFFCVPHVASPEIKPTFDLKILQNMDMKWIDIRPQAPWIRRSEEGVIFTSEVAEKDIELSNSETSDKHLDQDIEDQDNNEQPYFHNQRDHSSTKKSDHNINARINKHQYRDEIQQIQVQKFDPKKFKQMFQLDPETQRKLDAKFAKSQK